MTDYLPEDPLLTAFTAQIDQWVKSNLVHNSDSFGKLVVSLPGVDPSLIFESIKRLEKNKQIEVIKATSSLEFFFDSSPNQPYFDDLLPVPHPLDYEWRYDTSALEFLTNLSLEYSSPKEQIVLLGTPSLVKIVSEQPVQRVWTLYDANIRVLQYLSHRLPRFPTVYYDATVDTPFSLDASLVVADPPWYLEYLKLFIWSASHFLRSKGHLLLSVPPAGTRPGIKNEVDSLIKWAYGVGFRLMAHNEGILPYKTPPFEQNVFRALGLRGVPSPWRYGDLLIFCLQHRNNVPRPIIATRENDWSEVCIDGIRIKVKNGMDKGFSDLTLHSIVPGDILTSVSRRDPRRRLATVWTSGNRVFTSKGAHLLKLVLQAVAKDKSAVESVNNFLPYRLNSDQQEIVDITERQVQEIVKQERKEYMSSLED